VEDLANQLILLNKHIEAEFSKLDFPKESRKYRPHLTVARVKDFRKTGSVVSRFRDYHLGSYKNAVEEVVLMKSDLSPSGATYTKLVQVKLH
jgi:2'-5' RNA ligase